MSMGKAIGNIGPRYPMTHKSSLHWRIEYESGPTPVLRLPSESGSTCLDDISQEGNGGPRYYPAGVQTEFLLHPARDGS